MLVQEQCCKEGQFPYPESSVFAIFGISEQAQHPVLEQMRTLFVVSTQQALAELEFAVEHPGFIPQLILCLSDLRHTVEQLRQHQEPPCTPIAQRLKPAIFGQQPYLISYFDATGHKHQSIATACSAAQAKKVIPLPAQGVAVPLDLFEDLLVQMQAVQNGDLAAVYAWDFTPGGEWTQHQRQTESQLATVDSRQSHEEAIEHWDHLPDEQRALWK